MLIPVPLTPWMGLSVYELEQRRLPSGGDVYYAVRKFAEYGKSAEDLVPGRVGGTARVGSPLPQRRLA